MSVGCDSAVISMQMNVLLNTDNKQYCRWGAVHKHTNILHTHTHTHTRGCTRMEYLEWEGMEYLEWEGRRGLGEGSVGKGEVYVMEEGFLLIG